ncbi:MAG: autotransporter outer membrane beta-barrel domain-containing protein, partial [Brevundimonas sp.]
MRILLATAAALAPLMAAAGASAEVVISTSRTTVIRTSNATGSAPDNIRLASGGAINVASGSAITLDSNHSVDLDSGSSITMTRAASGATAIEARPGLNSGIIVGGTIRITDDIDTPVDTDRDGDADGPFASGDNRYGVRIVGPGTFTGDILVENTGSIVVEGNNSAGILVEPGLAGRIDTRGTISVVGNNTFGVRTQGNVQGVRIGSGVSALGDGAVGVAVDGNVSGQVRLQGAVSATGYRFTSRLVKAGGAQARPELLFYEDLDADDILQGGPAVRVTGDIGSGILLDIAPRYLGGLEGDDDGDSVNNGNEDDDGDGTINRNDSDRDGDGVPDAQETDSSLTVFGGAPALMIGSDTRASTIGAVGTGDNAFGVINHGTITSQGLLDGVTSTGIQLGAGQAVAIAGGFRNSGTISATAYDADARAVAIGAGVSAPAIVNSGTLQASGLTELVKRAFGLDIAAGATVSSLVNSGAIGANLAGEKGDAIGLRDASGTLTSIINTGRIFGVVTATDDEDREDLDPE